MREEKSPSYFNPHEVSLVKEYVQGLIPFIGEPFQTLSNMHLFATQSIAPEHRNCNPLQSSSPKASKTAQRQRD
jgi:hypothetical protein